MPRGIPSPPLVLSESDRDQLLQVSQSEHHPDAVALRARIVLACADGGTHRTVAKRIGIDKSSVGKWRQRYLEHGIKGLNDRPRQSLAPLILSTAERDQLQEIVRSKDHPQPFVKRVRIVLALAEGLSMRAVAKRLGVMEETVSKSRKRYLKHGVEGLRDKPLHSNKSLILSAADRDQLQSIAQSGSLPRRFVQRARVVLACTERLSDMTISKRVGVSYPCVSRWRERYLKEGIAGLNDKKRKVEPIKPLILSAADRDELQSILRAKHQFPKIVSRARILLALADGLSIQAVAESLGVTEYTVLWWHRVYLQRTGEDMDSLLRGHPKEPLDLSEADRKHLQMIARSTSEPRWQVQRARILLACAERLSNRMVAERVGVNKNTVTTWRDRYLAKGISCLDQQPRKRKPKYGDEKVASAIHRVKTEPPPNDRRWTLQSLAEAENVSPATVNKWLLRHGIALRELQSASKNSS